MEWEATAFGRPVLALVLIASLALFPALLIPSGPSMWLAGMIFGYGLGFVIIMVGTTIGIVLPYLIGLKFCNRIHYGKHRLTTVEIIYNIISFIIAVITIVGFTVYAKRSLNKLKMSEAIEEAVSVSVSVSGNTSLEMKKGSH
ncbi:hypothetical protein RYX36_004336 [Vicia faba]